VKQKGWIFSSLDVLTVAFNAAVTLSRLSFYGQCYSLLLLYFKQINDDDDDSRVKSSWDKKKFMKNP